MAKEIDKDTGWWTVKNNPLSMVGVFDYLGHQISSDLEPNKVYKVYRPAESLQESVDSWNNPPRPVILGHEMLGSDFSSTDDRPVQGVVTNVYFSPDDGKLYGDLTIYSDELKDAISDGTKDISLGYFCKYDKEPGIFNGQAYDFVQRDLRGNHVAVVPAGRCGSDVRVYDSKCAMDSLTVDPALFLRKNEETRIIQLDQTNLNKGQEMEKVDKREFIRKIMAIAAKPADEFEGGDTEKVDTIAKLLEKSEYAKSEAKDEQENAPEKKEGADKCGKDEDVDKRDFIRRIMAIAAKPASEFDGGDKEKVETIAKLLEKSEYSKSERGTGNDEANIPEILMYLKSLDEKLDRLLAKKVMDEESDKEKEKKEESKAQDAAVIVAEDAADTGEDAALLEYLK